MKSLPACTIIVLTLAASTYAATYGGGAGTPEDPFQIWTAEQLNEIGLHEEDWDKHFVLKTEIDLSGYATGEWNTIGSWDIAFTGVFDGNGNLIRNYVARRAVFLCVSFNGVVKHLTLADPVLRSSEPASLGGLVSYLGSGHVIDCHLVNADIRNDCDSFGFRDVGALVATNYGEIRRCSTTGSVMGPRNVGGLVGSNSGHIRESFSLCRATAVIEKAGGLVGNNSNKGHIEDCYAQGPVLGPKIIGGLVGDNRDFYNGYIHRSYSTGCVPPYAVGSIGGLVGRGDRDCCVSWSYWDTQSSLCGQSAAGQGLSTTAMKAWKSYSEWDFVGANDDLYGTPRVGDRWRMCVDGVDYPRLSWEFAQSGDFTCPDGVGMEDLVYLAERWLAWGAYWAGAADADGDESVNMADLAVLAGSWGE